MDLRRHTVFLPIASFVMNLTLPVMQARDNRSAYPLILAINPNKIDLRGSFQAVRERETMPDFKAYSGEANKLLEALDCEAAYFADANPEVGTFDAYPRDRHTYRVVFHVGMEDLKIFEPRILLRQGDNDVTIDENKVPPKIRRIADKMHKILNELATRHLEAEPAAPAP